MKIVFLGTSAGVPTRTRNVTSILLDLQHPTNSRLWLFDCGEGTQNQLLRTAYYHGKLDKIFITHLHGDHFFGLLGLLCSRFMEGVVHPLTIFGPKGIVKFVESAMRLNSSWDDCYLKFIEIVEGLVFDDGEYKVTARLLNHSIKCYGYRIEEYDKPGMLNAAALIASGIRPGPLFQRLKQGETVILEDGRKINGQNYLSSPRPGKKIAIFGDTAPCSAEIALGEKVDVIIHEATLETAMEKKANWRGHSSTRQAAELARKVGAKKLIITHISPRYNLQSSNKLLAECRKVFPRCVLAKDFAQVII